MARLLRTLTLGLALAAVAAVGWAQTPALITHTLTFEGTDEADMIRRAEMSALLSTVGRFYTGNRVVIARGLLEPFLERNRQQFVASVTVAGRRVDRGLTRLQLSVGVFASTLEQALEEYRFLFHPRPTPLTFVFLSETLDEQRQDVPTARPILMEALDDAGLQVSAAAVLSPDSRIDVSEGGTSPDGNTTLADALMNAERGGIELLFTGQITTTLTSQETLYYDEHFFYESTLLLRMFRVDTGELMGESVVTDSGSNPDDATAREVAIRKVVGRAVDELMEIQRRRWPSEIQGQTDYHLLVTDIDEDSLERLEAQLEGLDADASVHRHSFFHGVAVLNLNYTSEFHGTPQQERQALLSHLIGLEQPQLRVISGDTDPIELTTVRR